MYIYIYIYIYVYMHTMYNVYTHIYIRVDSQTHRHRHTRPSQRLGTSSIFPAPVRPQCDCSPLWRPSTAGRVMRSTPGTLGGRFEYQYLSIRPSNPQKDRTGWFYHLFEQHFKSYIFLCFWMLIFVFHIVTAISGLFSGSEHLVSWSLLQSTESTIGL